MADATSFLLPTDPFDVLIRHLDSLNLKPYDERLISSNDAIQLIRSIFCPPPAPSELRSEQCWHDEDRTYERLRELHRPMSPVLTQRARRETPELGYGKALLSIPRTTSSLRACIVLEAVAEEVIADPPPPDHHDILDVRYKLDTGSQKEIRSLVQSALRSPDGQPNDPYGTPNVSAFLRAESPTCIPARLESPPLFARAEEAMPKRERTKIGQGGFAIDSVADLVPMFAPVSPEVVEEEDGDPHRQHMQVVDGWVTYAISSPPSYHSDSSRSSNVDELWDESPPRSPPTSLTADMEEIIFPRSRKFGYGSQHKQSQGSTDGRVDLLNVMGNPGPFINSIISTKPIRKDVSKGSIPGSQSDALGSQARPPLGLSSPQSLSAANSLLGQPPSAADETEGGKKVQPVDDDMSSEVDLDVAIANIYASSSRDPTACILQERLDEKQILLMDVPSLPPPTTNRKGRAFHPERMSDLVLPKGVDPACVGAVGEKRGTTVSAFLAPVKGLKSLALDLSWMPFKFGRSIPTNEELAGVNKFRPEEEVPGYVDPETEAAVQQLCKSPTPLEDRVGTDDNVSLRGFEHLGASPAPQRCEEKGIEYVLTRQERNKVFGNATGIGDMEARGSTQVEARMSDIGHPAVLRQDESFPYGDSPCGSEDDFIDSGIAFVDDDEVNHDFHAFDEQFVNNGARESWDFDYPSEETDLFGSDKENINSIDNTARDEGASYVRPACNVIHPDRVRSVLQSLSPVRSLNTVSSNYGEPNPYETGYILESAIGERQDATMPTNNQSIELPVVSSEQESSLERAPKRRKLDTMVQASSRDLFACFMGLRNKASFPASPTPPDHPETPSPEDPPMALEPLSLGTPTEVIDRSTVRLPPNWINATTIHRYLSSMSVIQKRGLVRELQSEACSVALVERHSLGGCDIILDPDHGVLFAPLLALPSQVEVLSERISAESWRYSEILVIFEAYPSTRSSRADDVQNRRIAPYAYSPPIVKAVMKLRRIISISEGCESKDERCSVLWAFANSVAEAAKFVRCFGEEACAKAVQSGKEALWGDREWLEEEQREGESDLAGVEGMNTFVAFIMLYGRTLEDIFRMSPENRLEEFSELVGADRVGSLNSVIEKRTREIENGPSVV